MENRTLMQTKRFILLIVLLLLLVSCDNTTQTVISLNGAFEWINAWGGISFDTIVDSIFDADNNIYIAGIFNGEVDFDPGSNKHTVSTVDNDADAFVVKFSGSGKFKWVSTFNVTPTGISVDSEKNVYLIGHFNKNVDFNPNKTPAAIIDPTGKVDGFLIKMNSKGKFEQVDTFGGTTATSEVKPTGIVINSINEICICGNFIDQLQFNNLLIGNSNTECFLLKYSATMQRQWETSWGSSESDTCNAMSISTLDDILLTGNYKNTVDFDPGVGVVNKTSFGTDGYVLKLDTNKQFVWVNTWGAAGGTVTPASIVTDDSINSYICGSYQKDVAFDSANPSVIESSANDSDDCFYLIIDFNGAYLHHNVWGGVSSDSAVDLFVDDSGNIFIGGKFQHTVDFDPSVGVADRTSNGFEDAFLCEFDCNNDFVGVVSFGSQYNDQIQSVLRTGNDDRYVFGSFQRTVDFDTTDKVKEISSIGHVDCYYMRICTEIFKQ